MNIFIVFEAVALIFVMIVIGALVSRKIRFSRDTQGVFIQLIINVAMPCIILSSTFSIEIGRETLNNLLFVFLISIVIGIIGIFIGYSLKILVSQEKKNYSEIAILAGLGNTAFIGIPVCAMLFGAEGALYAAIFDAGVDVVIWSLAAVMLQQNRRLNINILRPMINIPMLSIVLGLILAILNIKPPQIVIQLTDTLATMAAPLAMIYIGILLVNSLKIKVKHNSSLDNVIIPTVVKLIILPLMVTMILSFININEIVVYIIIIQTMMPSLTLASILFSKYSANEELGSKITIISTLLSLITIPTMLFIVQYILR